MKKQRFDELMKNLEQSAAFSWGDIAKRPARAPEERDPVPAYQAADVLRLRKELDLTQRRFARALGVSQRTVETWEAGKSAPSGAARRLLYLLDSDHSLADRLLPRQAPASPAE